MIVSKHEFGSTSTILGLPAHAFDLLFTPHMIQAMYQALQSSASLGSCFWINPSGSISLYCDVHDAWSGNVQVCVTAFSVIMPNAPTHSVKQHCCLSKTSTIHVCIDIHAASSSPCFVEPSSKTAVTHKQQCDCLFSACSGHTYSIRICPAVAVQPTLLMLSVLFPVHLLTTVILSFATGSGAAVAERHSAKDREPDC